MAEGVRALFVWPRVQSAELFNFLPLGIGYLAANLPTRHQRRFFDGVLHDLPHEAILKEIEEFRPDVLLLSVWSFNMAQAREVARCARQRHPGLVLVAGGPEPSGRREKLFEDFPELDYGIAGEGEEPLAALLDLLAATPQPDPAALDAISGLIRRTPAGPVATQPRWGDITGIAHCDYEFIRFGEYLDKGYTFGLHKNAMRTAPILTTRGCPFSCTFCGARRVNGRKVRTRGVDAILAEMEHLRQAYGVDGFNIIDDNFTFHTDFAKAVCRGILARDMRGISLNCPNGVRMEYLDEELLGLMRRAGWQWVFIAPESGSPDTLKRMKKHITPATVVEKVKLIQKCGLHVFGFFIIGYPGETERDIRMTFRFAHEAGFDSVVFTCFHPLPGTPIFEDMLARGELGHIGQSIDYYEVNYAPVGISLERMKNLRLLGILWFHLRSPRRIWLALRYKSLKSKLVFLKKLIFS